jgi:hypothetical protein
MGSLDKEMYSQSLHIQSGGEPGQTYMTTYTLEVEENLPFNCLDCHCTKGVRFKAEVLDVKIEETGENVPLTDGMGRIMIGSIKRKYFSGRIVCAGEACREKLSLQSSVGALS